MALIVEDGTGVLGANSYSLAQDAIDYFAERGVLVDIADSDMIMATEFLETTYGPQYKGSMVDTTQSLLYPRTTFTDTRGRIVETGSLPRELLVSQYQAAKLNSEGVTLIANVNPQNQLSGFTKTIEGAVSKTESYFAPVNRNETAFVGKYIRPILNVSNAGRTVRA